MSKTNTYSPTASGLIPIFMEEMLQLPELSFWQTHEPWRNQDIHRNEICLFAGELLRKRYFKLMVEHVTYQ